MEFLEELAKLAPLATASVAIAALWIAGTSILAQRETAQRRAALDFFLKTEMDDKITDLFHGLQTAVRKVDGLPTLEGFELTSEYKTILKCLNIHELLAVGIRDKIFDEKICYNYWSDILEG